MLIKLGTGKYINKKKNIATCFLSCGFCVFPIPFLFKKKKKAKKELCVFSVLPTHATLYVAGRRRFFPHRTDGGKAP